MITIDKNIPITSPEKMGRPSKWKHIIEQMEVGDSILVSKINLPSVLGSLNKLGLKPLSRKQIDGNYRVWRVQ